MPPIDSPLMNKKKNKQLNSFDLLVESLIQEFSKIPNFDLTQKDETANKLFNITAFRIADISSFKNLVLSHFVPATNKAIFESEQQILQSKYKPLLTINKSDLKDTLHQTIRLSYVGLFHKVESYINDVIIMSGFLIEDASLESIDKYAKRKFSFIVKDWTQFSVTHKINWVCNCVKHYDGFPLKLPKPIFCDRFPENKRLELTPQDFKFDAEILIKFCPVYLQILFMIAIHKSLYENYDRAEWKDMPEILNIHDKTEQQHTELIDNFLLKLKDLAA